jgi:CelD/BcsL family acetyltransferase involved in cellulose biosynthesis
VPYDTELVKVLIAPADREPVSALARGWTSARAAQAESGTQRGAKVAVEIADVARLTAIRPAWTDLLTRAAELNVFMDPAVVQAAAAAGFGDDIRTLLAWRVIDGRERLVGAWAFAVGHPGKSPLPLPVLRAPPHSHGHLATPIIDRTDIDATLEAMLNAVAGDAQLPKIVALEAMAMDGPTMDALARVLATRDSRPCIFESFRRPMLASGLDGKAYLEKSLSSSSRKKLRQHRRRLAEKGALTSVVASEPDAVRDAMEEFLALEAAGWKGRQGTALLCKRRDAAFMRAAVIALAEDGNAAIHALYLDRQPASMQIIARCGPTAFTWKTAYDERLQDVSPGMLLLEDYTTTLLADASIASVDSCAHDDSGFMAVWTERQPVADLWFDVRCGGSAGFKVVSTLQRHYRSLRATAKDRLHMLRRARAR